MLKYRRGDGGKQDKVIEHAHFTWPSSALKTVTMKTNFEDISKTETHHHSHTPPINPHTLSWLQFDISDTEE